MPKTTHEQTLPLVQLSISVDAIVSGNIDAYRRAVDVVHCYRLLARQVDLREHVYTVLNSTIGMAHGRPRVTTDRKAAASAAANDIGAETVGKAALYSHRRAILAMRDAIAAEGGPFLGSHIWDSMRRQVASIRKKSEPQHYNLRRDYLVMQGKLEPLKLERIGMPVVHCAARQQAWLLRDERGYILRIQYGRKTDCIEFILHGDVIVGGKTYSAKLDNNARYIVRSLIEGRDGWSWQTPVVNCRNKRTRGNKHKSPHFWINIPYRRPAKIARGVNQALNTDVVFARILGADLPRTKHDTGTNDQKTFIVHAMSNGRTLHLDVDGVLSQLRWLQQRKQQLELVRDGRRRMPRRCVRPVSETIGYIRTQRERLAKNMIEIWTKKLVRFAVGGRCGTIRVFDLPHGSDQGLLLDGSIPWAWNLFATRLEQKALDRGIVVVKCTDTDAGQLISAE